MRFKSKHLIVVSSLSLRYGFGDAAARALRRGLLTASRTESDIIAESNKIIAELEQAFHLRGGVDDADVDAVYDDESLTEDEVESHSEENSLTLEEVYQKAIEDNGKTSVYEFLKNVTTLDQAIAILDSDIASFLSEPADPADAITAIDKIILEREITISTLSDEEVRPSYDNQLADLKEMVDFLEDTKKKISERFPTTHVKGTRNAPIDELFVAAVTKNETQPLINELKNIETLDQAATLLGGNFEMKLKADGQEALEMVNARHDKYMADLTAIYDGTEEPEIPDLDKVLLALIKFLDRVKNWMDATVLVKPVHVATLNELIEVMKETNNTEPVLDALANVTSLEQAIPLLGDKFAEELENDPEKAHQQIIENMKDIKDRLEKGEEPFPTVYGRVCEFLEHTGKWIEKKYSMIPMSKTLLYLYTYAIDNNDTKPLIDALENVTSLEQAMPLFSDGFTNKTENDPAGALQMIDGMEDLYLRQGKLESGVLAKLSTFLHNTREWIMEKYPELRPLYNALKMSISKNDSRIVLDLIENVTNLHEAAPLIESDFLYTLEHDPKHALDALLDNSLHEMKPARDVVHFLDRVENWVNDHFDTGSGSGGDPFYSSKGLLLDAVVDGDLEAVFNIFEGIDNLNDALMVLPPSVSYTLSSTKRSFSTLETMIACEKEHFRSIESGSREPSYKMEAEVIKGLIEFYIKLQNWVPKDTPDNGLLFDAFFREDYHQVMNITEQVSTLDQALTVLPPEVTCVLNSTKDFAKQILLENRNIFQYLLYVHNNYCDTIRPLDWDDKDAHGPPPSNHTDGHGPPLSNHTDEHGPPPSNHMDAHGPPPSNHTYGHGPPPSNHTYGHGPPPSNHTDEHGPPPPNHTDEHGPPPSDHTDGHGPPPSNHTDEHGPPPSNHTDEHGPPPSNQTDEHTASYSDDTDGHGPPPPNHTDEHGPPPSNHTDGHGPPPPNHTDGHGPPPSNHTDEHGPPPSNQTDEHGPPPSNHTYGHGPPPSNHTYGHGPPPSNHTDAPLLSKRDAAINAITSLFSKADVWVNELTNLTTSNGTLFDAYEQGNADAVMQVKQSVHSLDDAKKVLPAYMACMIDTGIHNQLVVRLDQDIHHLLVKKFNVIHGYVEESFSKELGALQAIVTVLEDVVYWLDHESSSTSDTNITDSTPVEVEVTNVKITAPSAESLQNAMKVLPGNIVTAMNKSSEVHVVSQVGEP